MFHELGNKAEFSEESCKALRRLPVCLCFSHATLVGMFVFVDNPGALTQVEIPLWGQRKGGSLLSRNDECSAKDLNFKRSRQRRSDNYKDVPLFVSTRLVCSSIRILSLNLLIFLYLFHAILCLLLVIKYSKLFWNWKIENVYLFLAGRLDFSLAFPDLTLIKGF